MSQSPNDQPTNTESRLSRRDSPALSGLLGTYYLSPAEGFDALAPTYDRRLAGNPLLALESGEALSALPELSGKSVADVGCGTGRYALQVARMGAARVVGIDLSPEMLAVARRKAERGELDDVITWRRGDLLERLPLADGAVDVVICALTLSFLLEVGGALREMSRVLASGGSLIVSDYHPHPLAQTRADAVSRDGNTERAPFLRFTSAGGDDYRIGQYVHTVSTLFSTGFEAGLALDHLAEPVPERHIANTYAGLRDQSGVPLALVARFQKR